MAARLDTPRRVFSRGRLCPPITHKLIGMFRQVLALTIVNLALLAQVQKQEIPATHETVYRVSEGDACNLSWTLAATPPNRTVAQLRTDCGLSL